jgi:hypothetical protein
MKDAVSQAKVAFKLMKTAPIAANVQTLANAWDFL